MLLCHYGHVAFPKYLVVPWDCVVRLLGGAALTRVGDDAASPECFDPPPAWIPCQGVIACIPQFLSLSVNSKPSSSRLRTSTKVFTKAVSPRIWNVVEDRPSFAWREGTAGFVWAAAALPEVGRAIAAGNHEHRGSLRVQ